MTDSPSPRYRAIGTTDDVTTCEICGRPHLKGTVILEVLDDDGNPEERIHAGSTCAARRTGIKVAAIRVQAAIGDHNSASAAAWAAEFGGYYLDGVDPATALARYMHAHRAADWATVESCAQRLADLAVEIGHVRAGDLHLTRFALK